jgi:hypothetical protein
MICTIKTQLFIVQVSLALLSVGLLSNTAINTQPKARWLPCDRLQTAVEVPGKKKTEERRTIFQRIPPY